MTDRAVRDVVDAAMARAADPARIAALRALCLHDGRADAAFDRLTRLAARFVGAPVALVNVVDVDRQVTRSAHGSPDRFRRGDTAPLADSMCKFAVATGEPLVIPDTRADPRVADSACTRAGSSAYAGVPLTLQSGHAIGSLCVLDDVPRQWSDAELAILTDLAAAASSELELIAMTRAAEGRLVAETVAHRLEAVLSISDVALHQATLDATLAAILARLRDVLGADTATVLLLDAEAGVLRVCASVGLEAEVEAGVVIPMGEGIAGRIAQAREPMIVPDLRDMHVASALLSARVRSLLGAPLLLGDELLGVVHVGSEDVRGFEEDDLRLLQLATARIAAAIERARLFDAEREARHAAETANRAKSQFLAVMSHELRTPLNAIAGHAELLDDGVYGPLTPEQRKPLERIRAGQRQLTTVISDILQVVDLERNAPLAGEALALQPVIDALVAELAAVATRAGVSCERKPCEDEVWISAPRDAVADILRRILDNAVKFTPSGGRITVACQAHAETVAVSVSDTGRGVPADRVEAVFEAFSRVDSSYSRAHEGIGVGLTIARARARWLGGDLVAEHAVEGGGRFTLTLPRVHA